MSAGDDRNGCDRATNDVGHLLGNRGPSSIEAVVVAVPARNEERRIDACLSSIEEAARRWGGPVLTVIGADRCTDGTVARVTNGGAATTFVVEGAWRRPSATRRAAVDRGLELVGRRAHEQRVWIANTDADSTVDGDWISRQIAMADAGVDLVAGVVALDPADTPVPLQAAFAAHYQSSTNGRRRNVHAANLGIRASVYRAVGGWRTSTAIGEEHHLVRAAIRHGSRIAWDDELVVRTSGRTTSRVRGGFASVLGRLERLTPAADSA